MSQLYCVISCQKNSPQSEPQVNEYSPVDKFFLWYIVLPMHCDDVDDIYEYCHPRARVVRLAYGVTDERRREVTVWRRRRYDVCLASLTPTRRQSDKTL